MSARRGIVILPAVAGMNGYIEGVVRRLAESGWQTEVVDYYDGAGAPDLSSPQRILEVVARVDDTRVLRKTQDAVERLQARGVAAVGALGYCIGGGYALLAGCGVRGLSAVANYYGGLRYAQRTDFKPAAPLDQAPNLGVPMIAHYGNADRFVPSADVDALEASLDRSGRTFELFRYAGAPHAFDEDFRPAFRPVASREAWERTTTFLDWYVRPG